MYLNKLFSRDKIHQLEHPMPDHIKHIYKDKICELIDKSETKFLSFII